MCPALLSALPVHSWGGPELCHELRVYRKDQELALCSWAPCARGVVVTGHCCGTPILLLPIQPPLPCECAPARQPILLMDGCGDLPSWHVVTVPAGTGFATQPLPIQVPLSIPYPGSPIHSLSRFPSPLPIQVPLSIAYPGSPIHSLSMFPYPFPIHSLSRSFNLEHAPTRATQQYYIPILLWCFGRDERAFASIFCYSKPVTCHVLL